jgi:hypothetical protein
VLLPTGAFVIDAVPRFDGGGRFSSRIAASNGALVAPLPATTPTPLAGPVRLRIVSKETKLTDPDVTWDCLKEDAQHFKFTIAAGAHRAGTVVLRISRH